VQEFPSLESSANDQVITKTKIMSYASFLISHIGYENARKI